jgi:deoxyribose-phosphate aldolase
MSELSDLLQEIPYREGKPLNVEKIQKQTPDTEALRQILGFIDLTTLDVKDTQAKVAEMCRKVNALPEHYPQAGRVAGVCVYPVFVPVVKETLRAEGVAVVSVSGGFPAAQTFPEVKVRETEMALEAGATEIDIVIPVGKILEGKAEEAYREVKMLREVIGEKGHLKVILESGVLSDPALVHLAAVTAMAAGADFIKTSTGKVSPAARPQDVRVMARAAKRFFGITGKRTGIKPAGGISTTDDALLYMSVIEEELGREWLDPHLFRIGASRLANDVLNRLAEGTPESGKNPYF